MTGVVKVKAGKDKGRYFLVVKSETNRVWIANGRRVKVQRPKAKNPKHLEAVADVAIPEPCTNRNVLTVLKPYTLKYYKEEL